ncbi:unnamed protein product [Parnassius mnemosyne]|uniref:Farnesyl pyrophosphate synthase n=1 Tax=Parnassius mnemosyne TaxID=213953 RepID=A0AAV1KQP0_9NEOP
MGTSIKLSKIISISSRIFFNVNYTTRVLKTKIRAMSTSVSISEFQKEKETFQDVLPKVIDSLVTSPKLSEIPEFSVWMKKILDYNLAGGKKNRGLTTVLAYEMLEKPENITDESLRLSRTMGWCVEMLQAYFLMADDIMDGSTTRRGVPCWYRLPEVGLGAINDTILVYTSMMEILKTHFGDKKQYTNIVNLFNETLLFTSIGQHLDLTMSQRKKNDYSLFTVERYNAIVKYKTAYYTFKLPVCLAMLLANNTDAQSHKRAEEISLEIGYLFQMQDDFIDCFGAESETGKAGTDIMQGKCSWLAVTALQRCNEAQRNVFTSCYGSREPAHIERILRLFEQLELPQLYRQEERNRYDAVIEKVRGLSVDTSLPPELFLIMLEMIYKRKL